MSKRSRKGGTRNPPAVEIPREDITEAMTCEFCHKGETRDILQSGRLYKLMAGKSVEYYHYFCCLFSSQGVQRGKDEEGLNGFLAEDVKKEVRRGATLFCDFCGKNGATIPCRRKSCKKIYHFSCGALCTSPGEHLFVFRNNMDSFCHAHGPKQGRVASLSPDATCMVCLDTCAGSGPGPGKLVSPCCGRTFHRDCVQKTALQAGKAALKCPACNDKDKFNEEMERCGVYIPHADAQWEMPENSNFYQFDDMLSTHRRCDHLLCTCPHGREFSRPGTQYEVIRCETCGQSGVHVACGRLEVKSPKYTCDSCQPRAASDTEDSDEEDRAVRERLEEHERRTRALQEEKQRLLYLIHEEKKKLQKSREDEAKRINDIKNILSAPIEEEPGPGPSCVSPSSPRSVGKWKNAKLGAPRVFIVSNSAAPPTPERYATNMPRRTPTSSVVSDVPDIDCDNDDVFHIEEEEETSKVPRIENVCGGSDALKLNDKSNVSEVSVAIEIESDDSDSDIEIIDTSAVNKKPNLKETLKS